MDTGIDSFIVGGQESSEPYPNYTAYIVPTGVKLVPNKAKPECSLINTNSETCLSENAVKKIGASIGAKSTKPGEIVKHAIQQLGCTKSPEGEEYCVLQKQQVLTPAEKTNELKYNFKVKGPTDVTLLNNINIDSTLDQWAFKFKDFYAYNFNMVDYEDRNDSLATVDPAELYRQGKRTAACVINSDRYSGRGKHWMALFLDMRDPAKSTAEFYNSSGNPPVSSWVRWMQKCCDRLATVGVKCEKVRVTSLVHQYSQTECGVYSLLYIWCRLNNVSWTYFSKHRVPDQVMFEFRYYLFRDPKNPNNGEWSYEEFKRRTKIKWEPDWVA